MTIPASTTDRAALAAAQQLKRSVEPVAGVRHHGRLKSAARNELGRLCHKAGELRRRHARVGRQHVRVGRREGRRGNQRCRRRHRRRRQRADNKAPSKYKRPTALARSKQALAAGVVGRSLKRNGVGGARGATQLDLLRQRVAIRRRKLGVQLSGGASV